MKLTTILLLVCVSQTSYSSNVIPSPEPSTAPVIPRNTPVQIPMRTPAFEVDAWVNDQNPKLGSCVMLYGSLIKDGGLPRRHGDVGNLARREPGARGSQLQRAGHLWVRSLYCRDRGLPTRCFCAHHSGLNIMERPIVDKPVLHHGELLSYVCYADKSWKEIKILYHAVKEENRSTHIVGFHPVSIFKSDSQISRYKE